MLGSSGSGTASSSHAHFFSHEQSSFSFSSSSRLRLPPQFAHPVGEAFRKSDAHSGQRTSTLPGESAKVDRLGSIGHARPFVTL